MALKQDLLAVLICPVCRGSVAANESETALKCSQCRRVYPVRNNIPVMLEHEARIED